MQYTQQAIEEAVKGGYAPVPGYIGPALEREYAEIFLDPDFWSCLGKSLGWDKYDSSDETHDCDALGCSSVSHRTKDRWKYHRNSFINHLDEKGDAESFFKEILNK